jgi:hypothetical protein
MDHHPIDHGRGTRGHGNLCTFHIDQTDPAGFEETQSGVVTQGGDVDPILFGYLKDRLIRPCRNLSSINCQLDHSV